RPLAGVAPVAAPLELPDGLRARVAAAHAVAGRSWPAGAAAALGASLGFRDELPRSIVLAELERLCGASGGGAALDPDALVAAGRLVESRRPVLVALLARLAVTGHAQRLASGAYALAPPAEPPPCTGIWRRALAAE